MKNKLAIILLAIFLMVSCSDRKIDAEIKNAEAMLGIRKFDEALSAYKLITENYPRDKKTAKAYLGLGDIYFYNLNNNDDALASYEKIIKTWPLTPESYEAFVRRAEIFKSMGRGRSMIEELEMAIRYFPENPDRAKNKLKIAEQYLLQEDAYQAAIELKNLMKMENVPDDVMSQALYDLGETNLALGEYESALKTFEQVEVKFPDAPLLKDVRIGKLECLENLGEPDQAMQLYYKLAKLYPDSDEIKRIGEALKVRGEKSAKPK